MYSNNYTLESFDALWRGGRIVREANAPEMWDALAGDWIAEFGNDGSGKPDMHKRVNYTAGYLRSRGLLGANYTVADIGCGPGLFVTEFAKTANRSVGFDYSKRFLEYGREYSAARGISNTEFRFCDFMSLDVDASGLTGAFDLVFTSITPVVNSLESLQKLIKMSRAYCYNASFVHTSDSLAEQISRDVFGEEYKPRRDGKVFYSLLNLVWLLGYYPETAYYDDIRDEAVAPTIENAAEFADECKHGGDEGTAKVLRWFERHGEVTRHSEYKYGSVLWDIRDKR
ncbi:MAG: class I SAM-dependent methyltransferase [Oscillospiraceae bacterium]|jgi:SAM-dependent methyltransferase|nr:class I SAM-dependent methyltransferase [Oscillospiraceae bacterium]